MGKIKKDKISKEVRDSDNGLKFLIAQRIQKVRKRLGYTAQQVATKMGTSRATITQIETGRNHINAVTLYKLASVLKCNVEVFFPDVPSSSTLTDVDVAAAAKESVEAAELLKRAFPKK